VPEAKRETFDQYLTRKGADEPPTVQSINALVARNLTAARGLRGFTQERLGQLLEPLTGKPWSKATVSALERSAEGGRSRDFDADDLVAIAKVTDVPLLFLFRPEPPSYHPNHRWVCHATSVDHHDPSDPAVMDAADLLKVLVGSGDSTASVGAGDATRAIRDLLNEVFGYIDHDSYLLPMLADVQAEQVARWRETLEEIMAALENAGGRS
jgi:transcriptional regulator with XRE-family HTH domain